MCTRHQTQKSSRAGEASRSHLDCEKVIEEAISALFLVPWSSVSSSCSMSLHCSQSWKPRALDISVPRAALCCLTLTSSSSTATTLLRKTEATEIPNSPSLLRQKGRRCPWGELFSTHLQVLPREGQVFHCEKAHRGQWLPSHRESGVRSLCLHSAGPDLTMSPPHKGPQG